MLSSVYKTSVLIFLCAGREGFVNHFFNQEIFFKHVLTDVKLPGDTTSR